MLSCMSCVYMLDINSLSVISFANIFSHSVSWHFRFVDVQQNLALQKLLCFVVQSLSHVWLCVTSWTASRQASLAPTVSCSQLKLMSIDSVMPCSHLILCHSPSPPALNLSQGQGLFQSQLFTSGGQTTGATASASVLPMNTQDWLPLGWTAWISLQSKGLSRVFSNTTVQKHQFFGAQLYSSTLTSIHDYWKNHSFDWMDLCWQRNVSALLICCLGLSLLFFQGPRVF